jgi:hypothetical protein
LFASTAIAPGKFCPDASTTGWQVWPEQFPPRQLCPHDPQFVGSLLRSTQAWAQQVAPLEQSEERLHPTQAPAPSQTLPPPLLHAVPAVSSAQVPFGFPVSALVQAWQTPPQGWSQHTPVTQLPIAHWSAAVHGAALGFWSAQVPPFAGSQ